MKVFSRSIFAVAVLGLAGFVGCSPDSNESNAANGTDASKVVVPPGTPTSAAGRQAYQEKQKDSSPLGAGGEYAKDRMAPPEAGGAAPGGAPGGTEKAPPK